MGAANTRTPKTNVHTSLCMSCTETLHAESMIASSTDLYDLASRAKMSVGFVLKIQPATIAVERSPSSHTFAAPPPVTTAYRMTPRAFIGGHSDEDEIERL